ncbi:hypothetical protein CEXT_658781 [Caerostris extrusa]|uniref:Uncharacterized protein n=1 Tax=Caerostris extrusa TaxID=172846 RepID=A0AAV4XR56_CAEEX|nr:hypothetical protein CEXT_658781 [Caerostris extrusa]
MLMPCGIAIFLICKESCISEILRPHLETCISISHRHVALYYASLYYPYLSAVNDIGSATDMENIDITDTSCYLVILSSATDMENIDITDTSCYSVTLSSATDIGRDFV